jgi:hypothetical protein
LKEQGVFVLFDSPLPEFFATFFDEKMLRKAIASKFNYNGNSGWVQPKGTFIKGPIKDVNRAIAKIYRAYAVDVHRITDIVRCRVVLDTLVDINNFLTMLDATCWDEQYDFNDLKQRVLQGQNLTNGRSLNGAQNCNCSLCLRAHTSNCTFWDYLKSLNSLLPAQNQARQKHPVEPFKSSV